MIGKKGAGLLFLLMMVSMAEASPEKSAAYVGWKKCSACHSAIADTWQSTRHAKAIENLKKTGQETLPACVKCHVTGYEQGGGFIDYELTPEMAGVQCEACHGPGGEHVTNPAGKDMMKQSGAALCRQCHTEGQDPGFNYEAKVKDVHGIGLSLAHGSETGELLKATPELFDAGTVAEGKPVEVTASVQNVGSVPIEITNVRTS